jgi:hypothetical protein
MLLFDLVIGESGDRGFSFKNLSGRGDNFYSYAAAGLPSPAWQTFITAKR